MKTPVHDLESADQLDHLMREGGPAALIDFWAPWCGPCQVMGPAFEAVAEQFAEEEVEFYKLNTQDHGELSARFHVRSIPTLILVNDGEILDAIVGVQSAGQIAKRTKWLLSKARGEGFLKRLFNS